ncbi:MAG: maleylpyruvate isomerase N-terminal domain-containing protein [Sporichthyaceae bacterium]
MRPADVSRGTPMDTDPLGEARAGFDELRVVLADAAARFCALLRTGPDPTTPALGIWNVGDLAAHLSHAWVGIPGLAARDLERAKAGVPDPGVPIGRPSGAMLSHPSELAPMTDGLVANDPERNLGRIADRIEASAKEFCERFDPDDPPGPRPWMLEGFYGEADLFAGHLLSETLVHGYDVATAIGVPWPMGDREAALVFRGFLLPIMVQRTALMARLGAPTGPSMAVEVRLAGDLRILLSNTPAGLTVNAPGGPPVDAHMWVRPRALALMAWSRRTVGSAVLGREVMVWGRRPWMAKKLLAMGPKV